MTANRFEALDQKHRCEFPPRELIADIRLCPTSGVIFHKLSIVRPLQVPMALL